MKVLQGNTYTMSDIPPNVIIGKYCSIAGGVKFMPNDDHACVIQRNLVSCYAFHAVMGIHYAEELKMPNIKGPVIVGNDVWIGEAARIMGNITIGHGAIIGTQSVVTKDVPPYALAAGNPAKVRRYRFKKPQIEKLLKIAWWDWPEEKIKKNIADFIDVDSFIKKHEVAD